MSRRAPNGDDLRALLAKMFRGRMKDIAAGASNPGRPSANSSPPPPQEPTRNQKENGVFPKLIVLIVATVAAVTFPATQGYAVPIFILVPQVTVKKRLDVAGAAARWQARLPELVLRHWRAASREDG